VKRLISFTELDTDFEDENLTQGRGDLADPAASPTELARPTRRKGLTQQKTVTKVPKPVDTDSEGDGPVPWRQDFTDDPTGGFGDDILFEDEDPEEQENGHDELMEESLGSEQAEDEEADDPPVRSKQAGNRARGQPKSTKQHAQNTASGPRKRTRKPQESFSSQPLPKRTRTTSAAPRSSIKIVERKEIPQVADVSMMEGDGASSQHFVSLP